jgi:Short C-terminal domain
MPKLTPEGEKIVNALAAQYKVGADAVKMMLDAVMKGGGTMAQFNVPEFGGNGQWMRGGMTMVGDMFNNSMKASVDALCSELSNMLATQVAIFTPPQTQSQEQGAKPAAGQRETARSTSLWWPSELGNPASTGAQNDLRYAYFPGIDRLAVSRGGAIEIYDTTGHRIYGFGQQQSGDASFTFSSQRGTVRLDSLPRTDRSAAAGQGRKADPAPVLELLEQLAQLKEKGILTEQEFASKKADLLKRL